MSGVGVRQSLYWHNVARIEVSEPTFHDHFAVRTIRLHPPGGGEPTVIEVYSAHDVLTLDAQVAP